MFLPLMKKAARGALEEDANTLLALNLHLIRIKKVRIRH
jgi:hypothetical protein